jgi:TonB-dependent starch-binding outer membrane protein SusC
MQFNQARKWGKRLLPRVQIMKVMKLTAILLLAFCLQTSAKGYAQNVTLSVKNSSLEKILKEIRKQTGYSFFYKTELLRNTPKINLSVTNSELKQTLDLCFTDLPIEYAIIAKTVVISPKREKIPDNPTEPKEINIQLQGIVVNSSGEPLSGASVRLKGDNTGTSTDINGRFSLNTSATKGTLIISFIGYALQEIAFNGNADIKVTMIQQDTRVDEVVVIGYGSVKKADVTGSVSSVSSEKLTQVKAVSNVAQALQGQAAGVQVNQGSGQPGEGMKIQIRGTNSIGAGNSPLYVVDGFPLSGLTASLNPNDIASVDVLKDASATAIYGSRGANGVIIITTKKGRAGKIKVSYDGYYGVQTLRKKIDLINASEFAQLQNEVATNDNMPLPWTSSQVDSLKGKGYDWQDMVYKAAPVQDHNLAFSGGNDNTKYYASFGYFDQDGIIQNSNYRRLSFRINLDQKITNKLSLTTALGLQQERYFQANYVNADYGGVPFQTMVMPATQGVYDPTGNYTIFSGVTWGQTNPVGMAKEQWNPANSIRIIGNAAFTYEIINGLKLRSSVGIDANYGKSDGFNPPTITFGQPGGVASKSYNNRSSFVNENTLNYLTRFGLHNLDVLAGITYQADKSEFLNSGSASGFISTIYQNNNIQSATNQARPSTGYSDNKLASYIGRINYNYDGKYFATLTGRYDGSSVFGDNNKFAFFPSAAVAWKISEEDFLKNNRLITDLKLRASYGSSGNQAIVPYQTLPGIGNVNVVFNNQITTGNFLNSLDNRNLKWETTTVFDIGFDLGLWHNRVQLTADYYNKKTNDLLLSVTLPPSSGFGSATQNVGAVQNRGFEFQINSKNIEGKNFTWSSTLTFSKNNNKILDLGKDALGGQIIYKEVSAGGNWFPMLIGKPMSQLYGQTVTGVYQTDEEAVKNGEPQKKAGEYKFLDYNKDGVVNDDDKHVLTNMNPKFTFGFNNTFTYKNFDLSLLFVGSVGNDIVNEFRKYNLTVNGNWTVTQETFDNRWKGAGTSNTIDKPSSLSMQYTRDYANSLWVENGSYIKLRDITLGYTIPVAVTNRIKISAIRIYVSAQNYLTITSYSGYDPEISWASSIVNGWDRGNYPSMKSITGGVKVNF